MIFIIFHGAFGGPEENWFPQLKERLESLGQKVIVPKFPVDDWDELTKNGPKVPPKNQNLSSWLNTFARAALARQKYCFVGHSLGCVFALHALEKFGIQLDSAIFVSPFLEKLNTLWQIDHANQSFYKTNFNFEKLKKLIPISYVLYSDNDPYVDKKYSIDFAGRLGSSTILVKDAGHFNTDAGYKDFPLVYELCKTRLSKNS